MKSAPYLVFISILFSWINFFGQPINSQKWIKVSSPTYSDLNNLTFFSKNSGIASSEEIIYYNGTQWIKMENQPPQNVTLLSAQNFNSIFITTNNELQESEMYYWNGIKWKNFYHPLANSISAIKFSKASNGVVASLGEVAVYKNNSWTFLSPPTYKSIISLEIEKDSIIWALSYQGGLYKYADKWEQIKNSLDVHKIDYFKNNIYVISDKYLGKVESDTIKVISNHDQLSNASSFKVIDENHFVVIFLDGKILRCSNKKWIDLESPIDSRINSIVMFDKNEGWCVGDEGNILHYTNQLYEELDNNIWKGFDKITLHSTAKIVDDEYGVVTEDFNNDGLVDIFTCGLYENNHLYINYGDIRFKDEATERGVSGQNEGNKELQEYNLGACAGDFDNDGNIDLYVSSLNSKNKLFKNTGGGFFVDYTSIANAGGDETDRSNSVVTADVNNDGNLDIFITNENSTNRLLLNNGAGIFKEITNDTGLKTKHGGTGAAFADIDNDGDQDLFIANWSRTNILYKNQFIEEGSIYFIDISEQSNVSGNSFTKSNGVVFKDINNDSYVDLFVTNRKTSNELYLNNGKGIFSDITEIYLGKDSSKSYGVVIEDFDGDFFNDIYITNVGENTLFKNNNGSSFINKTKVYNVNLGGYSTGTATADFDNDGDLDIYVANYIGESSTILVNKNKVNNFITLKIEGVNINRSGIGSKIYVYKAGYLNDNDQLVYFSEVSGGSGYGSMNELKKIIPLSNIDSIDLKIIFPSGESQIIKNIKLLTDLNISDEEGVSKLWVMTKKYFYRLFFDPHNLFILIKWLFVIILIIFSVLYGIKKYHWLPKRIIVSSFFIGLNYSLLSAVFEYKAFVYSTLLPLVSTITLITVFHLFYDKVMLRKKIELERQKLQEKLSRDLHDDLASTLGSVSIYLELLKQAITNKSENIWQLFNKANGLLNNSKQTITDLIWTIKPHPEPLENFSARIRENFVEIFREKNISFRVIEDQINNSLFLTAIEKHNVYLVIKEALNNILKHAEANKVEIFISKMNGEIAFFITDNGKGFNIGNYKKQGNGLKNLISRSNEIDAQVKINSEPGKGTQIELKLKK